MTTRAAKFDIAQPVDATETFARSTAGRKVLEPLRLAIMTGVYQPGERLIETKLADEYGVSRGSLRSALQVLENEGLIRKLPNGGKEICGFSRKDAMDAYDLRCLLETRAIEIICAKPQIYHAPLLEVLGTIEKYLPDDHRAECDWHMMDIHFHKAIMLTAENMPLLKSWDINSPLIHALMTLNTTADYRDRYIDEFYRKHKLIFDHIVTRNHDIFDIMKVHIEDAKSISSDLFDRIETKKKRPGKSGKK